MIRDDANQASSGANCSCEPPAQWFVLHTRSRQEKAVADDLRAMHIDHFLPLVPTVRYYGRRKAKKQLPLFPSYVFLRGSIEQAYAVDRTRRIARIIRVNDQARFESELGSIRQALDAGAALQPHPYLSQGMRVEVRSGPFRGMRGVIESISRSDRLILQVQTLGQASSLEIDGSLLEPLEPAKQSA